MKLWQWVISWYGPIAFRVYLFVSGSVEALSHMRVRGWGRHIIDNARKTVHDTVSLQKWYLDYGFDYRKDTVNCYSSPWLTAARHYGDCEDYALLSWEILRGKKRCVLTACHGKRGGKFAGHAILLVHEEGQWRVMSNMFRMDSYETIEKAAESVYGDKTIDYYFVK